MPKMKPPKPTPDCRKMYQLAEHYSEASRLLDEQAKGEEWGSSAPKLLVDSFAVELYLKCLFVLDTNIAPPEEHDWEKLFGALMPHTKTAIRDAFGRIVRSEVHLARDQVRYERDHDGIIHIGFGQKLLDDFNEYVKSKRHI